MPTPSAVKNKAHELIELFEDRFEYIGMYQGKETFLFIFPPETRTGFPFVYLYDKKHEEVKEITGFEALDIIHKCRESN